MPDLVIEKEVRDGTTRLSFKGDITEAARFDGVGPLAGAVVIDLSAVRRINSSGVREWVMFIRAVPATAQITYERCSPAFVTQAGMISDFLGAGRIRSLFAPYACEACGATAELLLDVEKDLAPARGRAPPRACEKCGKPMVFDDLEESFFAFL